MVSGILEGLRWLGLDGDEGRRMELSGLRPAVRFLVPTGKTSYVDDVHARIEFDHEQIEDFVILRSDGQPTYQLSVVADDVAMQISHVIRGDDHISNTPKQLL